MKLLLTILLFTTLSAKAQEAFVFGKSYPLGWVVWYPDYGTFYKSKSTKTFSARATPDRDPTRWDRFYYPVPDNKPIPTTDNKPAPIPETPAPTTVGVRQSAFDSLLARVQQLEARPQYNVISRAEFDTVAKKVGSLEKNTGTITFRVAQTGIPMIKKINDTTYEFPALTAGLLDSASKIVIKKAVPTLIKPTTKKTTVKK